MTRKKIIWITILLVLAAVAFYGYREYTRTNKDLLDAKPDYVLKSGELIHEFESSDSLAGKKYNGKIIELNGIVKKVEKDEKGDYTIVLGDSGLSSVRCSMDTTHQQDAASLTEGTSTIIRGVCTGFNKDEMGLGSDVILNRSAIINRKN